MKPTLLVIDMQNDFFVNEAIVKQKESLVTKINELVDFAHRHHIPVVWIRQIYKADLSNAPKHIKSSKKQLVIENTEGSKLVDGLQKSQEDYEVIKSRYSGFFQTELEQLLINLQTDTLIICGINTHACVRMTAIDAWQRDYDVIVSKDAVASYDTEHHNITMRYFEPTIAQVKTNSEIIKMMNL